MKTFPREFQKFVGIILRSKTLTEAYDRINSIDTVTEETARKFYDMYRGDRGDIREAFSNFYKDVKTGKYTIAGEVKTFKKFIKENLLREGLDDYEAALEKHDFYHMMSDDRYANALGRETSQELRNIYKSLNDEEKKSAAILFRDKLIGMNYMRGSEYNRALNNWNPEVDFDPTTFDGEQYWG